LKAKTRYKHLALQRAGPGDSVRWKGQRCAPGMRVTASGESNQ
jgi:hypothetical protein